MKIIRYCKKCGSVDNVSIKYIEEGTIIKEGAKNEGENEFIYSHAYSGWCDNIMYDLKAKKEHLEITCNTCGYMWRENVLG